MKASNIFQSLRSKGVCGTDGIPPKLPAVESSPATMKDNGNKAKLISEEEDPKTGITTKKYDVGTNMPKIVRTKKKPSVYKKLGSSPAKKKSCGYKK